MILPNDVCRCLGLDDAGHECARRDECLRYIERDNVRAPLAGHLCIEPIEMDYRLVAPDAAAE